MVKPTTYAWASLALVALLAASPAQATCDPPPASPGPGTPVTSRALIELSEIGFPDGSVTAAPSPVAVDPSGGRVAFIVARADLDTDRYCYTLMVLDLANGRARMVARGGDYASQSAEVRGLLANFGTPLVATPTWSPDGRWLAWLRREAGTTQVWVAATYGSGARQLTHSLTDIEDVAWDGSGHVLFSTRPAIANVKAAVDREGDTGWLYDDRVTPNAGPRPQIELKAVPLRWLAIGLDGTAPVFAAPPSSPAATSNALDRLAIDRSGLFPSAPAQLTWRSATGASLPCRSDPCHGNLVATWWQPRSRTAWFLRREGFKRETSALYRWRPGREPERMFATQDVLNWCKPATLGIVCLREGSSMPRRIVMVDWTTGSVKPVFDPNPGFDRYQLGSVTRLRWRNDRGLEAWGDLVLPPSYQAGEKVPLIVTQYHSRGFLRGGTGNDYPIFLFAQRGFAVLSLERPDDVATLDPTLTSFEEANRANATGWADRRSVQSSIEAGVRAAIATGKIDAARMGITGLSDGATSVRFALINAKLFAAAALSSCCIEPDTIGVAGPAFAKMDHYWGAPIYGAPGDDFWRPVSIMLNADRIDTPLLMQLSDDEYQLALGAFEALRARHKPVEMFVFPDEHHNKSGPLHRRAIFERSLDWFDFWLRHREDPDPAKRAQYARWEAMRDKR